MEVMTVLLLLTAAVAVNSRLPPIDSNRSYFRIPSSFGDVLKSRYLVNFHVTDKEKEIINKYFQEISGITLDEVSTILKVRQIEDAGLKSIAKMKLPDDKKFEVTDYDYNFFMLALNYNLVAQILDPEYEKNVLTIPLESDHEHTEAQIGMLDVISKRWATDLTGHGITLPEGSLANFYKGTTEEVEKRKKNVHRIYEQLDKFVLESLGNANTRYGLYPSHPRGPTPPPFVDSNKPKTIHKSSEEPSGNRDSKDDPKEGNKADEVKNME